MELVGVIIALLAAAVALLYAWLLQREVDRTAARLDRYNKALFQANDEIRQLREHVVALSAQVQGDQGAKAPNVQVDFEW
jgi:hypothetical protein